jgi:EAL domain-containing protein (putative c-di-GMP-specific phosphodiesterase class I)
MSEHLVRRNFQEIGVHHISDLELFAQPIVSLQNYEENVAKFEFLARFKDFNGKQISPDEVFTKNCPDSHLKPLDLLIFEESMCLLANNKSMLCDRFKASINVSKASVSSSREYLQSIERIRNYYGINSKNIALEITEFANQGLKKFTHRSLSCGYEVSVDDFASEHSTPGKVIFGVLAGIPLGKHSKVNIKLDRSFVGHIYNRSNPNYNIGKGVFQSFLGFKKDYPTLTLIAEGVESLEVADYLESNGVNYGQGFFWKKPLPFNEYIQPKHSKYRLQNSFDF